jgi:hypothetical protein
MNAIWISPPKWSLDADKITYIAPFSRENQILIPNIQWLNPELLVKIHLTNGRCLTI